MKNCYENRPHFPKSMPGFLCLNPLTVRKSKMLMVRLGFKKIMRQGKELGCDTGRPGKKIRIQSSVQFSRSVMSNSLQPHELQHARPPCPSPTPSSLRLTSIESVMPSSHLILCRPLLTFPQSLPASESFPMSQLFA